MGEWLPPKAPKHHCVLPEPWFHHVGDRWRCDCGVIYVIVEESQHGESWLAFKRDVGPNPGRGWR